MELKSKYGPVQIFAQTIEDEALQQIYNLANSPLGENAHIRIMPDCHAGAGCTIGTTMLITDKICPNIVGVDIGCGVDLIKTDIKFEERFKELDKIIREHIPFGKAVHNKPQTYRDLANLRCWDKLNFKHRQTAICAIGSLGGGNHFIEAYKEGYIAVHSGSRGIGFQVAKYYQDIANKRTKERILIRNKTLLNDIPEKDRTAWLENNKYEGTKKELEYLTDTDMENYLHDMKIMQEFASINRIKILKKIILQMNGRVTSDRICSTHNYIDFNSAIFKNNEDALKAIQTPHHKAILRKGAISALEGETLVIPLNMRDGILICEGKGNPDWNYSAPHGAGRLYSRSKAKEILKLEDYKDTMKGIYSTCISSDTLDEAPFAYKDIKEIMELIEPTVTIIKRLIPIYNFKASE